MRVLLFAPVDLNLIDGSAIWCASVAQMLGQDASLHIDILLNTPLKRTLVTAALTDRPNIRLLDPWNARDTAMASLALRGRTPRLTPEQAFERIECLDVAERYDLLILRGGAICQLVADEPSLAARAWFYLTQHGADFETVRAIARSNGRIACQTPLLQEFLESMLGTAPDRYVPLPPMVPRLLCERPRTTRAARRLCYVGKFDPHYLVEEMVAAFAELRGRFPDAEFIVAGDKFHDPTGTGEFRQRLTEAFENTPGVSWRGALSREDVGKLMTECDIGSCWRCGEYDSSLELSTKVLEYAAAGLAVLLNPTRINRLVFGEQYPLYVDTPESFVERVAAAWEDGDVYARAAKMAFDACNRFTFAEVKRTLDPYLSACRPAVKVTAAERPLRVLFAGHDLKFCREIIDHFSAHPRCTVRIDQWSGHVLHGELRSVELLHWADVIWCEWCLGNAVWYSNRVRPAQRLIVRYHRQELTTPYPEQVAWSAVDHLVFIAPHVRQDAVTRLGPSTVKDHRLIYNTFACDSFDRSRPAGSEFRLGMLGYCPKLKNPMLAVEILRRLAAEDERWRLVFTGRAPQTLDWLWALPEERKYYERFEEHIAANNLEGHLIRQDWTDDAPDWYANVGYILSCSDLEGSHQAIAEGMAAGCVPVVRRWSGAAEMYPNALLFDDADEAAALIRGCAGQTRRSELSAQGRRESRDRFDTRVILPQLEPLVLGSATSTQQRQAPVKDDVKAWTPASPAR